MTRSFTMPLSLLEGLSGKERTARIAILQQGHHGAIQWMTLMMVHVEMILYLCMLLVVMFLLPESSQPNHIIDGVLTDKGWYSNLFALLAMALIAPFFVACGFSLYIMRRTALEGWDIELHFKQLAQKIRERRVP